MCTFPFQSSRLNSIGIKNNLISLPIFLDDRSIIFKLIFSWYNLIFQFYHNIIHTYIFIIVTFHIFAFQFAQHKTSKSISVPPYLELSNHSFICLIHQDNDKMTSTSSIHEGTYTWICLMSLSMIRAKR